MTPGGAWCRLPEPQRILEIQPITWLLEQGAVVICAGGGGIPTTYPSSGSGDLVGVEAVIDKDFASELLAEDVGADLFVMATDVDGVYVDWGTPEQKRLGEVTPGRTGRPPVRGRVHGPEGRGGGPLHREDRQPGGDRLARRHHRNRGRESRHERGQASGGRVTRPTETPGAIVRPVPEADGSVWHALSADRVLERRR